MFYVEQPPSAVSSHDSRGRLSHIIPLSFNLFPYSAIVKQGTPPPTPAQAGPLGGLQATCATAYGSPRVAKEKLLIPGAFLLNHLARLGEAPH
jgi:hypothetical protein